MDATALLKRSRIVPVVVIDDPEHAVPLAETLLDAGLNVIEITLRSAAAVRAIELVARSVPEVLVGAGSVRHPHQVSEVVNAGAAFAVSPGWSEALLVAVSRAALPFVPGSASPSDMIRLLSSGYRLQKFFPAEVAGGIAMLRAVSSPIPEVQFMPTGGISAELASRYLALPNVACIGGSWIAPSALLEAGDFGGIGELATDAARLAL